MKENVSFLHVLQHFAQLLLVCLLTWQQQDQMANINTVFEHVMNKNFVGIPMQQERQAQRKNSVVNQDVLCWQMRDKLCGFAHRQLFKLEKECCHTQELFAMQWTWQSWLAGDVGAL